MRQSVARAGFGFVAISLAGCVSIPLPSAPDSAAVVEGYIISGSGFARLYPTLGAARRSNQDCIQLLRPASFSPAEFPPGRVRVSGRFDVFDNPFELAGLQVGGDHATHELCQARYLIVDGVSPAVGNRP
ncbi:MAG TPA: hypothetical protein PLQ03_06845 [Brevundimonas sp.]|uniref:hypothetical protein n=1 Tax=Brevundimonas sp. TaxID=1871086 RepID=UPI0026205BDF|nr:hypothetical protein [Brevundimonas sp.]HRO33115.1 hypothetical protein [Brevundimonas sp.]